MGLVTFWLLFQTVFENGTYCVFDPHKPQLVVVRIIPTSIPVRTVPAFRICAGFFTICATPIVETQKLAPLSPKKRGPRGSGGGWSNGKILCDSGGSARTSGVRNPVFSGTSISFSNLAMSSSGVSIAAGKSAATIVILTSSSSRASRLVPKMMLALGSAPTPRPPPPLPELLAATGCCRRSGRTGSAATLPAKCPATG